MKGFPRRGSNPGERAPDTHRLSASMKGFPRRGSNGGVGRPSAVGPARLNEGLPQKGKQLSSSNEVRRYV